MDALYDHPAPTEVGALGIATALAAVGKGLGNTVKKIKDKIQANKAAKGGGAADLLSQLVSKNDAGGGSEGGLSAVLQALQGSPSQGSGGGGDSALATIVSLLAGRGASPSAPVAQPAAQAWLQPAVSPQAQPLVPQLAAMRSPYLWPQHHPAMLPPAMSVAARNYYRRQAQPYVYVGGCDFDEDGDYVGAVDGEVDDSLAIAEMLQELDREIARLEDEDAVDALALLADSLAEVQGVQVEVGATRSATRSTKGARGGNTTGRRRTRRAAPSRVASRSSSPRAAGNRSATAKTTPRAGNRSATNESLRETARAAQSVVAPIVKKGAAARQPTLAERNKQRGALIRRASSLSSSAGPVSQRRVASRVKRLQRGQIAAAQVPARVIDVLSAASVAVHSQHAGAAMLVDKPEGAEVHVPAKDGTQPYKTGTIAVATSTAATSIDMSTENVDVGTLDIKALRIRASVKLDGQTDTLGGGVLVKSVTPNKQNSLLIEPVFLPLTLDGDGTGHIDEYIESLRYSYVLRDQQTVAFSADLVVGPHPTDTCTFFCTLEVVGELDEQKNSNA